VPETQGKTWMSTVAGVLSIVAGAFNILTAFWIGFLLMATLSWTFPYNYISPYDLPFATSVISVILIISLIFCIIGAVFPVLGGIFALQRRHWGWSLAGAIVAIFTSLPFGVLATIFIALGKDEFQNS
jgi:hypothetical protein